MWSAADASGSGNAQPQQQQSYGLPLPQIPQAQSFDPISSSKQPPEGQQQSFFQEFLPLPQQVSPQVQQLGTFQQISFQSQLGTPHCQQQLLSENQTSPLQGQLQTSAPMSVQQLPNQNQQMLSQQQMLYQSEQASTRGQFQSSFQQTSLQIQQTPPLTPPSQQQNFFQQISAVNQQLFSQNQQLASQGQQQLGQQLMSQQSPPPNQLTPLVRLPVDAFPQASHQQMSQHQNIDGSVLRGSLFQETPAKRLKVEGDQQLPSMGRSMDFTASIISTGSGVAQGGRPCVGEARFTSKEEADRAVQMLSGSIFKGSSIHVRPDVSSIQGNKVLIFNVPVGTDWTELRDYFAQAGQLTFCGIDVATQSKGYVAKPMPNFTPTSGGGMSPLVSNSWSSAMLGLEGAGEVRFDNSATAQQAIALLNGASFKNAVLSVVQDTNCRDGSRVLVFGVPEEVDRHELRVHMEQAGRVEFCGWKGKGSKGAGKAGKAPGVTSTATASPEAMRALQALQASSVLGPPPPTQSQSQSFGEVIYNSTVQASQAVRTLSGSQLRGSTLSVQVDASAMGGGTLTVYNLPLGCTSAELQAHCASKVPEAVPFAVVHEGPLMSPPPPSMLNGKM